MPQGIARWLIERVIQPNSWPRMARGGGPDFQGPAAARPYFIFDMVWKMEVIMR